MTILLSILAFFASCMMSFFIYNKKFKERYEITQTKRNILFGLRTITVFLILFLLINPYIKISKEKILKPMIVFAVDNSQSMRIYNSDKLDKVNNYIESFKKKNEDKFNIRILSFGEKVKKISNTKELNYNESQTNFQELLETINSRFLNQNFLGTVIFSDGNYNYGTNPSAFNFLSGKFIYSVFVGDTITRKDVYIKNVVANDIVFYENEFIVNILLGSKNVGNQNLELTISKGGKTLKKQKVSFSDNQTFINHKFILNAQQVGLQKYDVTIEGIKGEETIRNNHFEFYVDVIDNQSKILILASAPHPDIRFLYDVIKNQKQYSVTVKTTDDFNESFDAYNLVITHNVPNKKNKLLKELEQSKTPSLNIIGNNIDIASFNKNATDLEIKSRGKQYNNIKAIAENKFNLFRTEYALSDFENYPPIYSLFADFNFKNAINICFKQKIGSIDSQIPLLAFSIYGKKKAWFLANGFWQWSMYETRQNITKKTKSLFLNIIQFLILRENKKRLHIKSKSIYGETENVLINAELYNENYQLINEPNLPLILLNEKKEKFEFKFQKKGNFYQINLGFLPKGKYSIYSEILLDKKLINDKKIFYVKKISIENIIQNKLGKITMSLLANKNNGDFYLLDEIREVQKKIINNYNLTPKYVVNQEFKSIISWKFILFVILLLFSIEWYLRKKIGIH